MKLKKLLAPLTINEVVGSREIEITGICADSRRIVPGNLFIARRGTNDDGSQYIPDAIAAGAAAIATDLPDPSLRGITQIVSPNLRTLEAALAAEFYGHPSEKLYSVGITGTNGKTTTSFILRHLFESLGKPTGLMGTIETIIGDRHHPTTLTTADPTTTQKALAEMVKYGCKAALHEVSSHGLDQERTHGIDFDVAVYTNLSQDHLDYHGTMENYAAAKAKLFAQAPHAILNRDDPWFETMRAACTGTVTTYGLDDLSEVDFSLDETLFSWKETAFSLPLIGRFNLYNALAALHVALHCGYTPDQLVEPLATIPPVRGRLEPVPNPCHLNIYVDFAHTPDALQQVLTTLHELNPGRLITVFGCGGDRDQDKRPKMGQVASRLSDITIITSDNPRSEDPQAICDQIADRFDGEFEIVVDREEAIERAVDLAKADDVVLIAGKGHETYQVFAHRRIPFDDREVAEEACKGKSCAI